MSQLRRCFKRRSGRYGRSTLQNRIDHRSVRYFNYQTGSAQARRPKGRIRMFKTVLTGCLATTALLIGTAQAADCMVGISMKTLNAPYFAAQEAAAKDQAAKAGCQVTTADAQNDMGKQIGDVEDMVSKGVNLLI